jgi:caffeoyl-CoA O-methyltransferase
MTKRRVLGWLTAGGLLAGLAGLGAALPPRAGTGEPVKDIDQFLDDLYRYGQKHSMWNVRPGDGRFLQVMAGTVGAKRVLELGTANGYSGIWICRALRETGGKLLTIEIDERKAQEARENFAKVGMSELAEVRVGDVSQVLPQLEKAKETFDLIFMDTEKGEYLAQFRQAFPLLRPGGVFLAHNVVLMRDSMKDFLGEIERHPQLVTAIAQTSDDGFSVSYRKR